MRYAAAVAIIDERARRLPLLLGAAGAALALAAWWWYSAQGVILSHYDTKGHLVVARRVFDSLTPGWKQIGAVWLPLPHLLNMLPVQVDSLYRTGFSATLISVTGLALASASAARLTLRATGSVAAACTGAALLALNPNLLYLGATPMTEPLLLGLVLLAVADTYRWVQDGRERLPLRLGLALAAAAWTRYEAWPVIAALAGLAGAAWWRQGRQARWILDRLVALATWPAIAALVFLLNSYITVGSWFVSSGFFVPDPVMLHRPAHDLASILWGARALGGSVLVVTGLSAAAWIAVRGVRSPADAPALVALAPLAATALPALAFFQGHPFRVRYMVPLVAALALTAALGTGWLGRLRRGWAWAPAAVVLAAVCLQTPPFSGEAAMVREAQWDRPASVARQQVTRCLAPAYRGELVLASMGSLAHYMQELSAEGFALADFINEGNGVIWELALERGAAPLAGWMLVEEHSEGGDVLAQRIRTDPAFAAGMTAICEGGGVTLYRRGTAPALARR